MSKRRAVVLLVLLLIGACGGGSSSGDDGEGEVVDLTLQVGGEREEVAAFEALAGAFDAARADVRVRVVTVPGGDDHVTRLTSAFATGTPPDLFVLSYRELAPFLARDAVAAVGPMLEERGVDLGGHTEVPFDAMTLDGILQCFPMNASSLVVYVNTRAFRDAGLPLPTAWTWEEFQVAAGRLATGGIRGVGIAPRLIRLAPFVWMSGGALVDDQGEPRRLVLDSREARSAAHFVVELARGGLMPSPVEVEASSLEERFASGRLGMLLSSRREVPRFREAQGLEWDVAPLPVPRPGAKPTSILHTDGLCVSARKAPKTAAGDFVAFAASLEAQTLAAFSGRLVPTLEQAARGPFLDPTRLPSQARVWLDQLPNLRATPLVPGWPEVEDIVDTELERAFAGEQTTDEALAAAVEKSARVFERE